MINDPQLMEEHFAEYNAHHLNHAHGPPFTVEHLYSLIGINCYI